MDLPKRKTLMKTFVISQLNYCPLIWMFHCRKLNNCINSTHERALRTTYQDYKSSFSELLHKDDTVTIHQRNLHTPTTDIFKVKNDLSPETMKDFFELKKNLHIIYVQMETHYGL